MLVVFHLQWGVPLRFVSLLSSVGSVLLQMDGCGFPRCSRGEKEHSAGLLPIPTESRVPPRKHWHFSPSWHPATSLRYGWMSSASRIQPFLKDNGFPESEEHLKTSAESTLLRSRHSGWWFVFLNAACSEVCFFVRRYSDVEEGHILMPDASLSKHKWRNILKKPSVFTRDFWDGRGFWKNFLTRIQSIRRDQFVHGTGLKGFLVDIRS